MTAPMRSFILAAATLAASCAHTQPSGAPSTPSAPPLPAVQGTPGLADAMGKLSFMRGVWAGPAKGMDQEGRPYSVTQTERMGPMLGGDVVVIEGRGYKDDNSTGFNAPPVGSWNP